jgi:hypothetical protein
MTAYMDNQCVFFNTKPQAEKSLKLLEEFNKIAKIRPNPTNQNILCSTTFKSLLKVNDKLIFPEEKKQSIRLLKSFFGI